MIAFTLRSFERTVPGLTQRGQVVLEAAFFLLWFVGFFAMTFFFFNIFEISQKQTMLVRTQAFIELGNYSNFGKGIPGKEKATNQESRLDFILGEKTEHVHVDLDKLKPFKSRVEGDLELFGAFAQDGDSVVDSENPQSSDSFWASNRMPRNRTRLVWRKSINQDGELKLPDEGFLQQTLSIALNRSIDPAQSIEDRFLKSKDAATETGMFSGSLNLGTYKELLQVNLKPLEGLSDNLDALKKRAREIAKDDPSLSDEAEKIEKTIKGNELDSSAAMAALINNAISIGLTAGISALSGALEAVKTGSDIGGGAFGGAVNSLKSTFGSMFNSPVQMALEGSLISGPINAMTEIISVPAQGVGEVLNGLGDLKNAAPSEIFGSVATFGAGTSKLIGTAEFAANVGGNTTLGPGAKIAETAFALPDEVNSGWSSFVGRFQSHDAMNKNIDVLGAFEDLPRVIIPVTTIVALTNKDLAMPLTQVTGILTVTSAAAAGVDSLLDMGEAKGRFASFDNAKTVAEFTTYTGAVLTGVGAMTKNEGLMQVGGGLMIAGPALLASAEAAEALEKFRMNHPDFKIGNPVEGLFNGAKNIIEDNFRNAGEALQEAGERLSGNFRYIENGLKNLSLPRQNDANFRDLAGKIDLLKQGGALDLNMQYHIRDPKIDPELRAELMKLNGDWDDSIRTMDAAYQNGMDSRGKPEIFNKDLMAKGRDAALKAGDTLQSYHDLMKKIDPYTRDEVASVMRGNAERYLELSATLDQKGYGNVVETEKDAAKKDAFYWLKTLRGSRQSLKTWQFQEDLLMSMNSFMDLHKKALKNDKLKKKLEAKDKKYLELAQKISINGPVRADPKGQDAKNAGLLADYLTQAATRYENDPERHSRFLAEVPKLRAIQRGDVPQISPAEELELYQQRVDRAGSYFRAVKVALKRKLLEVCDNKKCMQIATARD